MTPADRQRLARILGMLGSEHAGERASAALQAEAFRKRHGLTWEAMLTLPPVEVEKPSPPRPPEPPRAAPTPPPPYEPSVWTPCPPLGPWKQPRPLPFERIWRPKMEMAMSPRGLFFAIVGVWVISITAVIAEKF